MRASDAGKKLIAGVDGECECACECECAGLLDSYSPLLTGAIDCSCLGDSVLVVGYQLTWRCEMLWLRCLTPGGFPAGLANRCA